MTPEEILEQITTKKYADNEGVVYSVELSATKLAEFLATLTNKE
jgi:hypothetical protein